MVGAAAATSAQGSGNNIAAQSAATALDPTAYLVNELFRSEHPDVNASNQIAAAEARPIIVRGLGEGDIPAADKTYLARLVTARTGLSQPEAAKRIDDVNAQVKSAWVKAHQAADQARKAASYMSFFTAFSMLIGAFIAAVAATLAGHRRDEVIASRRPL